MENELLKGNFKVKKPITSQAIEKQSSSSDELRDRALASLGGSMVYMEKTDLTWDGE